MLEPKRAESKIPLDAAGNQVVADQAVADQAVADQAVADQAVADQAVAGQVAAASLAAEQVAAADCAVPNETADVEAWKEAQSFDDLCKLSAAFVEGEIKFHPGWDCIELYPETESIRTVLAEINRAGMLTIMSQPADIPFDPKAATGKRAFVTGFLPRHKAITLRSLLQITGLYIANYHSFTPMLSRYFHDLDNFGDQDGTRIVVHLQEGYPEFSVCDDRFAALANFERYLDKCGDAMSALGDSSFVVVVDHEWGRNTLFGIVAKAQGNRIKICGLALVPAQSSFNNL